MKQNIIILIIALVISIPTTTFAQGYFFKQVWAEHEINQMINNSTRRILRVNDKQLTVHERFGTRKEANSNGILLIKLRESVFEIEEPVLYLELWGGHAKTANKSFIINGKEKYDLPYDGTVDNNCAFTYPYIPLKVSNMVTGYNALQFTCDRGETFWGHYFMDEASFIYKLKDTYPGLEKYKGFTAEVKIKDKTITDNVELELDVPSQFINSIVSVEYFAKYKGYDDNGNFKDYDWHGYTQHKENRNNIGKATSAPYKVNWNTEIIPSQDEPMEIKARINFIDEFSYMTSAVSNLSFPKKRKEVQLIYCDELPKPFWSRDMRLKETVITLPDNLDKASKAWLIVKIWDGGEGTIKEHFKINDISYKITSNHGPHELILTIMEIDINNLKKGGNVITLLSDTEHHGIEVMLPGPALIIKY